MVYNPKIYLETLEFIGVESNAQKAFSREASVERFIFRRSRCLAFLIPGIETFKISAISL